MNATQSHICSVINDLIEICRDGQEGFRLAAENITNPNLRATFNRYSLQRASFVGELQQELHDMGEHDPENESSTLGTLHRSWINLKAAISGKDPHSILAECERGEDAALRQYEKTLAESLPHSLRGVVERQYFEVREAHNQVKKLRDTTHS